MKKLILISLFGLSSVTALAQDYFFNSGRISEVKLEFNQPNWDHLLDSFYVSGDEERLLASVWIDGSFYDSVGVRYKGFSSVSVNRAQNPFNIKLDYTKDQNHFGVEKLKLGNVIQDPSFVREILSYKIARNYIPASESNFCLVYINNVFWGVYTSVESVDNSFLSKHFGNSNGTFIKCNPETVNLNGENSNLSNTPGADTTSYYNYYALRSDQGWADFYQLIDKLNNSPQDVEQVLNIDRTLWMHALNYSLVNFDSYIGYAQNYYLYQDKNGQFNPILWDLNQSFGSFRLTDASTFFRGFTIEEAKTIDPLAHVNGFSVHPRPLIKNVINTDQRERMYLAHIRTILQDHFENNTYKTELDQLQNLIKSDVERDTNKFYSYQNFLDNKTSTVQDLVAYPGITDLMDARADYLLSYSGILPSGAPQIEIKTEDKTDTDFSVSAEVKASDIMYLYYRENTDGLFNRVEMKDDGLSGDGGSADGIFGSIISTTSSNIDYYIYAENDSSGSFIPTNAAYNFYSIRKEKSLVINEFCALNSTIISDEEGKFEDWIELYNTTNSSINMAGYYLSDDADELEKWAFPNTTIDADGYLLVWADNDEDDGLLHANFKLSSGGEAVYLSNNGEIVDQVIFGGQTEDISYGRSPNGTGSFALMEPTPKAYNSGKKVKVETVTSDNVVLYPNPATSQIQIFIEEPLVLRIINAHGQEVKLQRLVAGYNNVDISDFSKGIYYAIMANNKLKITKKLMKI